MNWRGILALGALALTGCLAPAPGLIGGMAPANLHAAKAGSFAQDTYKGYVYRLYTPSKAKAGTPVPLVVMLHGCAQDSEAIATGSRLNEIGEAQGFAVLYPEQQAAAQMKQCWRWFDPADQQRGEGEPAIITGMIDEVQGKLAIDKAAVYVGGISAGGAMAVILAANYPERFAAVGVGSGLEHQAASNEINAWQAMAMGGPDPAPISRRIVDAMGKDKRLMPMIVFHGTADYLVNQVNATQVVKQWTLVNDLVLQANGQGRMPADASRTEAGQIPGGRHYTRAIYQDSTGRVMIEKYIIDGMPHAWSGGSDKGSYTDPKGPDASKLMWEFFKDRRR